MRILVLSSVLLVFVKSTTPRSSQGYYEEEYLSTADVGTSSTSIEELEPQGRILGFLKGWKGDDDHPLTEFGKIHVIKKPGGWGGGGGGGHYGGGGGGGWGWGQYGPGWTTTYHVNKGWTKPAKKSWFKFPKKSFGIHVKGGVGFSFGGKKGHKGQGQTVVVEHSPTGWGWNSGYGQGHQGWGWGNRHGGHGGHGGHGYDEFYGGDYYDDGGKKPAEDTDDKFDDESVNDDIPEDGGSQDDDDDRRRMDLHADYLYDY